MRTAKLKTEQKKIFTRQGLKKDKLAEEDLRELKKKALIAKADRTKSLLESVSSKMELLEIESFDNLFPILLNNMKEAAILREELIKEVGLENLMKYRPELFSTAKLIERKFDNTIEKYSQEEKRLEKELSRVVSKKKITNYLRY